MKKVIWGIIILIGLAYGGHNLYNRYLYTNEKAVEVAYVDIGTKLDSYKGVSVFNNGKDYVESFGKNYSKDGYYYGYKWQCVEFIKRFYYDAKGHKMPDVYGNAKDFFDSDLKQGKLNKKRGLVQYKNGDNVPPKEDDLIVFNDTKYGHVAIVTEVTKDYIEIIQQNIYGRTRDRYKLTCKDGKHTVGGKGERSPAGWLRKE
jgi:surface antigen